ncbi:hypothetical protein [Streptomyces torulosus]|nr:hypothetical protein [Streptomyces torulosus]
MEDGASVCTNIGKILGNTMVFKRISQPVAVVPCRVTVPWKT